MSADPQPPLIHSLTAQTLSCPSDTVRATAAHGAPRVLGPWDQHDGATLAVMAAGGKDAARAEGEGKAGQGFRTVRQPPPSLGGSCREKGPLCWRRRPCPKPGAVQRSVQPLQKDGGRPSTVRVRRRRGGA